MLDLLDHAPSKGRHQGGDREPIEHIVEESEDHEPLGLLGGDTTRRQVVQLVLVDRADAARVLALHVVGLDLEVGDGLRLCAFGQHQIAVGLGRVRLVGARPDVDQPRVHGLRGVFHRTLEEQVAAGVGAA